MASEDETVVTPARGPAHGQLCYLQIPARNVMESAAFYERIFGWRVQRPYPSFDAPGLIGQWVTDRPPAREGGLLAWINVERIDDTVEAVRTSGGEVLEPVSADGPRWLATIRDPAGNVIGVVQHGAR